ncbi:hypothetical protein H0H93_003826 [Arthromyces matolae]|nr:hypothetical protein H0H93_003826 [Arthromyces matolae]
MGSMPAILSPPSPCSRRPKSKPYASRRRQQQRSHHPFDDLPWVDALNSPATNDLWDIADISQIPDKRRKRASATSAAPDLIQSPPPRETFSSNRPPTSRPTTPLSRFIPSKVIFHNLMPVLCEFDPSNNHDDLDDATTHDNLRNPCTSISPLQPSFFHLLSPRLK